MEATTEELAARPTAIVYGHLAAGDEGYWPVIGAVPDDIEPGDRVSFAGDTDGDIVVEVRRKGLPSWPCRIGWVDPAGKLWTCGRMAQGFRLDRWGNHAVLSDRGTR